MGQCWRRGPGSGSAPGVGPAGVEGGLSPESQGWPRTRWELVGLWPGARWTGSWSRGLRMTGQQCGAPTGAWPGPPSTGY